MYLVKTPKAIQHLFKSVKWTCESDSHLRYTFDDGPHPESTPKVLDILDNINEKGTFFCNGKQAERFPELITLIKDKGHQIGNHGYAHISGWRTRTDDYLYDVAKANDHLNAKYFRPAYGKITWNQYQKLKKKYTIVLWDVMTGDFSPTVSSAIVKQRVDKYSQDNSIILFHDRRIA